jgi:tetratricopeptide (TPR) repeat protein
MPARSVEELRRELPVVRPLPPLSEETSRLMSKAAEALARNDLEMAAAAAREAAQVAPDRPEPVEVEFLVALGAGRPSDVRAAIARLGELDPRNSIAIAFAGLEGIQNGDDRAAVSALAWFVGADALARRGSVVPLPTAVGELEEQCALSALRLGQPAAALTALDAASRLSADEPAIQARLSLLRADVRRAAGSDADAIEALEAAIDLAMGAAQRGDANAAAMARGVALLASIRLDALRCAIGKVDEALEDAVEAVLRDEADSVALVRVERIAPASSAQARERLAARLASVAEPTRGLRFAAARSLLLRDGGSDQLVRRLVEDARDRPALRLTMRLLAARGVDRAVSAACDTVLAQPNELDAVARALLGCGAEVEVILAALDRDGSGAAGDALRSRIHGQYGFSEEAFAIADAARTRDRASSVALAACAFAAAELEDETLLAEVDDDAVGAGNAIARTLAACAFRLSDYPRARERAMRAIAQDPTDTRARLLELLAAIELGADREQALREIRAIAAGRDSVAADAFALLSELNRGVRRDARESVDESLETAMTLGEEGPGEVGEDAEIRATNLPKPRETAQALLAAATELDRIRHPLAAECLALAEEADPSLEAARRLAARASRPDAPKALSAWTQAMMADAPGLPSRRRVQAALREPVVATELPKGSIVARFDALQLTSDVVRSRDRAERTALRPRTAAATAALAEALVAAGDSAGAAKALESISASTSGPLPPRAARRLLKAATAVAVRDSASVQSMQQVATQVAVRLAGVGPEEMAAVMRLAIAARVSERELETISAMLASACRAEIAEPRERFGSMFGSLLKVEEDPFPLALLADALAREKRLDPALRGFLGNAAVALQASAGGPASRSQSLVRALFEQGAPAFVRPGDEATTLGESLLRAASAYSLVGEIGGSDELLRAAISADSSLAPALNNLAFSMIESGKVDAEVVSLAERAARLVPDDPSILDTLGVVRYHQGRFRDDAAGPGAITLFRQALRVDPDDPSLATLDHLGDTLWRDGDQAGAIRCWQQVSQVAKLRYPPDAIARGLAEFQRREFGFQLVSPVEFVQKEYGRIVDRAEQKLQEVARGVPPSIAECRAVP